MLARQIYDEQLPVITKVLSAGIVGLLDLIIRQIAVSMTVIIYRLETLLRYM